LVESGGETAQNADMTTLRTVRRNARIELLRLGEIHGAHNVSIIAGGALGTGGVDLAVEMDQGRSLFDLAGFVADVQDLLGVRIGVLTIGGLRATPC
jgi:predicted nucleotidyltransferase